MAVGIPRAVKSVGDRRRMCSCAATLGAMFLTNVSVSSIAYCTQPTTQTTTKTQTQQDTEAHILEESVRADAQVLDATTKANAQTLEAIEKSNAQSIDAVTKTSIATYAAAKDVLEHTEWVVSIASLIVAGVVSLAAFFGFRNISGIAASIRKEAIKQTNEEMAMVSKNMRQVMKFSIRAQAAVRQALVAEQWSDVESKRLEAFDNAIVAIK